MKLGLRLLTVVAILLAVPVTASGQTVTLAWDATPDADVTGYRVYYGTASRNYSNSIDVGNRTTYTVSGLEITRAYYFAVVAYGQGGVSDYSAEVMQPASPTRITSLTSSHVSPFLVGQAVTWTAVANSTAGPVEYKFLRYSAATGWTIAQDWSAANTLTFTPGWGEVGSHSIQAWARTVGSTANYEAWIASAFTVNPRAVTLTADLDFPAPPGSRITWTASVAGTSGQPLEYRFLAMNQQTGAWSVLREYETGNQFVWTPTTLGSYVLQVWVRSVGSTATYQAWAASGVATISRTTLSVSVSSNVTMPAKAGTPITWTARPRGGMQGPIEYEFVRYSYATNTWAVVRPYSQSPSFTWTPNWNEDGRFVLQVWARNAGSTATYDAWTSTPVFQIERAPLVITLSQPFPVPPGTAVTLTTQVGATGVALEYQFLLYDRSSGTWSVARAYGTSNTFTWTPTVAGTYIFQVWARQVGSSAPYEIWRGTDYLEVSRTPARVVSLTADRSLPVAAGTAVRWTAQAVGGTASPLQYRFFLYNETTSTWSALGEYSSDPAVTWTPTAPGRYLVQAWVRSAGSTAAQEGWMSSGFFVITP